MSVDIDRGIVKRRRTRSEVAVWVRIVADHGYNDTVVSVLILDVLPAKKKSISATEDLRRIDDGCPYQYTESGNSGVSSTACEYSFSG